VLSLVQLGSLVKLVALLCLVEVGSLVNLVSLLCLAWCNWAVW
jgi:hypothetical protein